jgi:hypothetical protein
MDETPKRQTLEELGRELFGAEFLKECDDEYRRMEIVGSMATDTDGFQALTDESEGNFDEIVCWDEADIANEA